MSIEGVPSEVARLAVDQRLGRLVDERGQFSDRRSAPGFFAAAAVALGVAVLLGMASAATQVRLLGFLAVFCVPWFLVLAVWGVKMLFRGPRRWFLYEGGLVQIRNGRTRAVTWPQITAIVRRRAGEKLASAAQFNRELAGKLSADTVTGYEVLLVGGGKVIIEMGKVLGEDYTTFLANLEGLATQGNATVTG